MEIADDLLHLGLGVRREIERDVIAAQRHAERILDQADRPLPARTLFGGAAQVVALELPLRVDETLRQIGRGLIDGLERFPGLQRIHRRGLINGGDFREGGVFRDDDLGGARQAGCLEIGCPGEARRGLGQVLLAHRVVGLDRVAAFGARPRHLGDRGFQGDDGLGMALRIRIAGHVEHPGDIGFVKLQLVGVLVGKIIVAVGQGQARLAHVQDVQLRVLGVGADIGPEKGTAEAAGRRAHISAHLGLGLDGGQLGQQWL